MSASFSTHRFEWQGLSLTVEYSPDWSEAMSRVYGYSLAHLAIRSDSGEPLPITETGYRSAFLPTTEVEQEGGPEPYVRAWLDAFAGEPAWREAKAKAAQLSLF